MRVARSLLCLVAIGALVLGPARRDAWAQDTEAPDIPALVPASAPQALVIPNPRALSDAIASLNARLELNFPVLNDLLGVAQGMTGFTGGVDETAPMVALMPDMASLMEGRFVVLVPVSDYAAFLGARGVSPDPASPVSAVELLGGVAGFVRSAGDFAVLGIDRATVETIAFPPPAALGDDAVGTLGAEVLAHSDVVLIVNVEAMPILRPMVAEGLAAAGSFYADNPELGVEMGDMMGSVLRMYGAALDAFLRDTTVAVLGLDIGEAGVGLTMSAQFREGSNLAAMFTTGADCTDLLDQLPGGPWFVAVASIHEGIDLDGLVDAVEAAFPETSTGFAAMMRQSFGTWRGLDAMAGVFHAPDPGAAAGSDAMFRMVTAYYTADVPAYMSRMQAVYESMDGLSIPLGPTPGAPDPGAGAVMTYHMSYEANHLELDGHRVDRFTFETTMPPELEAVLDPTGGALMGMFGMGGYSGYMADAASAVVITSGLDQDWLRSALQQFEAGGGLGTSPAFSALREHALRPGPSMEIYVDVAQLMSFIHAMEEAAGPAAAPLEVPPGLEPAAIFGHVVDSGLEGRVFIPYSVARFLMLLLA